MSNGHDWLQVDLDQNHRRGLADAIEANAAPSEERARLFRILRSSRNEFLLDTSQAEIVLAALDAAGQMSALRARVEAFLGQR